MANAIANLITELLEFFLIEILLPGALVLAGVVILYCGIRYYDTYRKPKKRSDITKQK